MDILLVNTNLNNNQALLHSIIEAYPNEQLHSFVDPLLALKYGTNNPISILITSENMRGVDGHCLAKLLRRVHPKMEVIFVNQGQVLKKEDLNAIMHR